MPAGSQQWERQRRVGTCCQERMRLWRQMLQQVSERGVNRLLGEQVVVVQDQEELLSLLGKTVDERLQGRTQRGSLLGVQVGDQLRAESGQRVVQGCEHIPPEQHRLI